MSAVSQEPPDAAELDGVRAAIGALPPLRTVLVEAGFGTRKSLGQHFILDRNLTDKIAASARAPGASSDAPLLGATIVEVGPGPGGLTRSLLAAGARVIAVEKDARAVELLAPLVDAAAGRLVVRTEDALNVDWPLLVPQGARICANLPYNVATPLIAGWLGGTVWPSFWQSAVVMVQKEVAQRMAAPVGSSAYGRLSVLCQSRCTVSALFDVPPDAFVPPPKVWSSVVRLDPHHEGASVPVAALERVTAAAFGQRRKMLRSSLKPLGDAPALMAKVGLEPTERAERVPVAEFVALARAVAGASASE